MTHPEREAVRRQLRDRLDDVGDRVVAAVAREIPTYAGMGGTQARETRAIATWAVERLADLWAEDGSLTSHDLRRFHGIGVSRATDGRPLPVVLRAYRVAAVETSDVLVGLGDGLSMDDVVALNRVLLTSLDQLSEALFAGYTTGADRLAGDRESALQQLFDDLVVGRQTSAATLADRAAQLGIAVPASVSLLVVRDADGGALTEDRLAVLVPAEASGDHSGAMVLRRLRGGVGALLAPSVQVTAQVLAEHRLVGCRLEGVALADVRAAYRLALAAVERAPAEAFEASPVLRRGDALVVALLARDPAVGPAGVAAEVLGDLLRPEHQHLLDGLTAYLRAGSATVAAQALGLHAQTMRQRLRRVSAVSGRDPRRSWDRLVLDLARVELAVAARR